MKSLDLHKKEKLPSPGRPTSITVKGARVHNLRDISVSIPRNRLVVITGLSGSGKSSLAFDTIYAEGQRRYLESLSAYARQFMEQMIKPDVDAIDGLSPAISIEQKNTSHNPRSTVGTVTEIYDFLRLMYARLGTPHCPECGKPIQSQTSEQITDQIMELPASTRFSILAPVIRGKKGEYQKELQEWRRQGFTRARIDGVEHNLSTPIHLKKSHKHDISVYVDRLVLKSGIEARVQEAVDMAIKLSEGLVEVEILEPKKLLTLSTQFACLSCGTSYPEIEPRSFSFNSQYGACPTCNGLGTQVKFDPLLIVPNPHLSLKEGAILPWSSKPKSWLDRVLEPLAEKFRFSLETPFEKLSEKVQSLLLNGSGGSKITFSAPGKSSRHAFEQDFPGVVANLEEKWAAGEEMIDEWPLSSFITYLPCAACDGTRLKKEALSVILKGRNIAEFSALNVEQARAEVAKLKFTSKEIPVAEPILKEVSSRLEFLDGVGLSYLTLNRSANTLSGGEFQRIRLATQIGSSLVGVLYVLDEPSIGLHQRDNDRLIGTLERLRDLGNSVLVVEHDEETIERADHVVDIGPGAGVHGGHIVYSGPPKDITRAPESITGKFLSGALEIAMPEKRRKADLSKTLILEGASAHNLKNLSVKLPLGVFICVSGVSGSGKSSLIIDTLLPALQRHFAGRNFSGLSLDSLRGVENLDKITYVDQSPIGRTPRSNPATYTGVFTDIRALFAQLPEAKARGYTLGRFSFNVEGGRCEACRGDGTLKITMHFLPDVFVPCEVCEGKRYNRETLEVLYRGKSIADILEMSIEDASLFFDRIPSLKMKFQTLNDVGLGYIKVGQNAVTLSGGEAQRIKLARELTRRATGKTIYILDEPTTGLHFHDVKKLMDILQRLVDQGNTALVIEHNLDVIKQADYVLDLGPEGGNRGGQIIFSGTPEGLMECKGSFTGQYLKQLLSRHRARNPRGGKSEITSLPSADTR